VKITSRVLAEKIAKVAQRGNPTLVTPEMILEGVPELAGFDTLAEQLGTAYKDAQAAFLDEAYRTDSNFKATADKCAEAYEAAVREAPEEPVIEDGTSMIGPVEEDLTSETGEPADESNGAGGFEMAPDETEQ